MKPPDWFVQDGFDTLFTWEEDEHTFSITCRVCGERMDYSTEAPLTPAHLAAEMIGHVHERHLGGPPTRGFVIGKPIADDIVEQCANIYVQLHNLQRAWREVQYAIQTIDQLLDRIRQDLRFPEDRYKKLLDEKMWEESERWRRTIGASHTPST
jgi:hypothetical protein